MIPALYLEKISSKKLPNFFERLLAVSDEGNFFITFDENIKDVLNVHQIQNEEIISSQISFEEELDLSHYYKYFDDQERNSYVKTVKINIKNNSTTIIYVPTENINRIAKVTLNTPLIPDELISNTNGKEAVIQYHEFDDRIRDIALHPIEKSLVVLTFDHLFILEENKTIELNLTGYNYPIHHMQSDLVVVEEDGEVDYYAFFKLKIDIRTYLGNDYDLKVRKIHEITYAETYESNEELNVPLQYYSLMQKIGYDKKNNIFAVTTSGDDWDYYTIYFNDNLELLKVQEKFTGSYIFMFFSQKQNTMFMVKDFCKTCSKTPGCYNQFSVWDKTITIEEPEKCYSETFERKWYQFYNVLGEIDIDVNNRTDQYLYTENYIFNTDVTDADIKENKSPDLYYQNRYFSQPNLKSSPYEYTLKNQDHVVYLEDGNFQVYQFRTEMVTPIEDEDDDSGRDDDDNPITTADELSIAVIVGIVLGGICFILLVILIIFVVIRNSPKQNSEDGKKKESLNNESSKDMKEEIEKPKNEK